ncbi:hypothetical protein WP50_13755, partial [Lactiplantibacillus plantarum]
VNHRRYCDFLVVTSWGGRNQIVVGNTGQNRQTVCQLNISDQCHPHKEREVASHAKIDEDFTAKTI